MDDFADYFAGVEKPRLLITTTAKPSKVGFICQRLSRSELITVYCPYLIQRAEKFVRELELLFPMSEYRKV